MNLIHKTSIPLFAAAMAFAFHADAHNHEKPASPAAVAADMVEGEVRKVDKEAGKVTPVSYTHLTLPTKRIV